MLKSNKQAKPVAKTNANTLKDEREKKKKTPTAADKTDKKVLTKKSDFGLASKSVSSKNVKSTVGVKRVAAVGLKPATSKKNVMNTIHNVTVASPPSSASKDRSASTPDLGGSLKHARSRTRTIPPEESMLVKQSSLNLENVKVAEPVKDPVAFEINFKEAKTQKPKPNEGEDDDYNYESDFESYESDFEPEVPSSSESDELETVEKPEEVSPANRVDSGTFELSVKKSASSGHYDSIDDTVNSHDSGISYEDTNRRLLSPRVQEFYRRGEELMKKITFDDLKFDIFEMTPIAYETFMSVYGQRNMSQVGTQSESMQTVDEVQTDAIFKAEAWTQFPAKFTKAGLETVNSKLYNEERLGVGEGVAEVPPTNEGFDSLSASINTINNFSKSEEIFPKKSEINFNSSELQRFVESAAMTMESMLDSQSKVNELNPSKISVSRGFTNLKFSEIKALKDTKVTKIYSNLNVSNVLVTTHARKDSTQNFLCLWDVMNTKRPLKIFSSWSSVNCLEIHENQRDVVVGGCSDGTICLWDAHDLPGYEIEGEDTATVKPCEIISLNHSANDFSLDNTVALKSLPHRELKGSSVFTRLQASQICSLHKSGTVVIWTIQRAENIAEGAKKEMEFVDAQSRVRLMRNLVIDLNVPVKVTPVKRKSAFEKTRYYFENDLFSDKVLRELQEIDSNRFRNSKSMNLDEEPTKFTNCAVSLNEILVASDLNFILAPSRLNLGAKSRKIYTNHSTCIAPTTVKLHPTNQNVLAVGQSNGEVKFVRLYDDATFSESSLTKHARKLNDSGFVSDVLAKSCAFQNIVEKEKKFYSETQALNNLESDELKAFLVNEALAEQFVQARGNLRVSFDKNIFNSFEVSPGAVSAIEFNKSGELMFVLVGRRLRIFNCWSNCEVEHQEKSNMSGIACVQCGDSAEYLVLTTVDSEILVNKLKH